MSRSPPSDELNDDLRTYQASWRAARKLIHDGRSWSGHERNCAFLNTADDQFANLSAISGLDFDDDGRAVAVVDWDHDGDLDLWLRNRTGPRLRLMKNQTPTNRSFVAFRLTGTQCNRDAIGARVEVHSGNRRLVQTLTAGDGFISQSSKWMHFGLGDAKQIDRIVVRWPDRSVETIADVEIGKRYHIVQGSRAATESTLRRAAVQLASSQQQVRAPPSQPRLLLSTSLPLPELSYTPLAAGRSDAEDRPLVTRSDARATLVSFWASWCAPCLTELSTLQSQASELRARGIDVVALSVDALATDQPGDPGRAMELAEQLGLEFKLGLADRVSLDKIQVLMDALFDRRVPLGVPTSLLLDQSGRVAAIYAGPLDTERLYRDAQALEAPFDELRRLTLPFAGRSYRRPTGVSLDKLGDAFHDRFPADARRYYKMAAAELEASSPPSFVQGRRRWQDRRFRLNLVLGFLCRQQGLLDEALNHARVANEERPDDAGTWQLLGQIFREQANLTASIEAYQRAVELLPEHAGTHQVLTTLFQETNQLNEAILHGRQWVDLSDEAAARASLGYLLGRSGQLDEAETLLRDAVTRNPSDVGARINLGLVLEQQGEIDEAATVYRSAIRTDPSDADAHVKLAAVLRRTDDDLQAITHLRQAVRLRPDDWRAQFELGDLLEEHQQIQSAISAYEAAWRLNPRLHVAANNLAWILATHPDEHVRDGKHALQLAAEAVKLTDGRDPGILDTLAAAQAENGDFQHAQQTLERAIEIADSLDLTPLLTELNNRLKLYQRSQPYRQAPR